MGPVLAPREAAWECCPGNFKGANHLCGHPRGGLAPVTAEVPMEMLEL